MTRPDRTRLDDPTAERTGDPVPERNRAHEDVVRRRSDERDYTPRRYDQPADADGDPVMPSEDPSLNVKI
ncbi:MAG TPA: hypothetical protein VE379_01930 [Vicinamibacterales bacterium]|jgi:hypothetical protein|nr:hypothetical protein [Vicinamibacterales bacterium]